MYHGIDADRDLSIIGSGNRDLQAGKWTDLQEIIHANKRADLVIPSRRKARQGKDVEAIKRQARELGTTVTEV